MRQGESADLEASVEIIKIYLHTQAQRLVRAGLEEVSIQTDFRSNAQDTICSIHFGGISGRLGFPTTIYKISELEKAVTLLIQEMPVRLWQFRANQRISHLLYELNTTQVSEILQNIERMINENRENTLKSDQETKH